MSRLRQLVAQGLYAKIFRSPHWRVGWRHLDGPDLWESRSLEGTRWMVLPDPRVRFFADPIAITVNGRTVLFVEDFDHATQKGVISAVEFSPAGPVGELRCVLEEPWHLSYPFVTEIDNEVWMIPESGSNREVALYRAHRFPDRWVKEVVLLRDIPANDATLLFEDGLYWLFTTVESDAHNAADLHLFFAPSFVGPWKAHPGNPVLRDASSARSAGKIVRRGERLWRPVQNCSHHYGASLGMAEILQLDKFHYRQVVRNTLAPCREWPGRRLHTLSQAGGFEFIDGSANVLRWP